jgi:hypothetical protein
MAGDGVTQLPLYHEDRACTAPTAARVFDAFADVRRHRLTRDAQHVRTFEPQLTPLQHQLLELLDVPERAYPSTPSRPRPPRTADRGRILTSRSAERELYRFLGCSRKRCQARSRSRLGTSDLLHHPVVAVGLTE